LLSDEKGDARFVAMSAHDYLMRTNVMVGLGG
jgi:hypothetical protein